MKLNSLVSTTWIALSLILAAPAILQAGASSEKKSAPTEAEIITKARTNYPLKTCLVSNESLGSMGDAFAYVHRSPGHTERVVFMCCEGCVDDFKQDPAKFLKKVDDAAAKSGGKKEKKKKSNS